METQRWVCIVYLIFYMINLIPYQKFAHSYLIPEIRSEVYKLRFKKIPIKHHSEYSQVIKTNSSSCSDLQLFEL